MSDISAVEENTQWRTERQASYNQQEFLIARILSKRFSPDVQGYITMAQNTGNNILICLTELCDIWLIVCLHEDV